jgi:hypothetical protein
MRRKTALLLFAGLSLTLLLGIMRVYSNNGPDNDVESQIVVAANDPTSSTPCLAEADVMDALKKLSTGSQLEADHARDLLLENSKRAPICRKETIATLIRAMDRPNLDFRSDRESFDLWRGGVELLDDLKATEALDLLIKHLDKDNGKFSTTMSQQPALRGVINMGPVAIPKLEAVLRQSADPNMRRYAVYCITGIGGDAAINALQQALPYESDACVSRFISISIDVLNNKTERYSSGDQVKWFWAFMCTD